MGNIFVAPTADKIARGYDLSGKVALVTGGSSGIGLETTRALVKRGATACLTCRELEAGNRAKRFILEKIGGRFGEKIHVLQLDLASLQSANKFVEAFFALQLPLHFLILNAAILGGPFRRTKEGFEMHFGVNYLGHVYLIQALLPLMKQQMPEPTRIIARMTKLKLKYLPHGKREKYSPYRAYDQSKLALRYYAEKLSLELWGTNVAVVGADPGVTYTWIIKNLNPIVLTFMAFASIFMKTPEQGAATIVFACVDRRVGQKQKPFCSGCRLAKFNFIRNRDTLVRDDLYDKTSEWIRDSVFDSCNAEAFDPKMEVWRSISKMLGKVMKQQKRRFSDRRLMQGATKYNKLD